LPTRGALASAAGLSNVEFRETSFEELLGDASLPEFDAMCMHGVYSWVSPHNRAVLVSLIRKKLRPGWLLYISYDSMPGLGRHRASPTHSGPGFCAATRITIDRGGRAGARLFGRVAQGGFALPRNVPVRGKQIERLKKTPRAYLAHELLTRDWEAFSFGDLVAELSEAKLAYLGSAHLTDWVDRVNFTEEQQAFLATVPDPILAESSRDMILGRQFRRDIFVKGLVPITENAIARTLAQYPVCINHARCAIRHDIRDPPWANCNCARIYTRPLIQVLGEGPITLHDLIDRLPTPRPSWISLTDAIKVLVGRGDLQPCLPEDGEARRAVSHACVQFGSFGARHPNRGFRLPGFGGNRWRRARRPRQPDCLISHAIKGVPDAPTALAKLAEATTFSGKDGKPLSPDDARAAIEKEAVHIESNVLPMLQWPWN